VGEALGAGVSWSLVVRGRGRGESFIEQVELGGREPFERFDMRLLEDLVWCPPQQLLLAFDGCGVPVRDARRCRLGFEFDLPAEDASE
jgi:hypothetical protein